MNILVFTLNVLFLFFLVVVGVVAIVAVFCLLPLYFGYFLADQRAKKHKHLYAAEYNEGYKKGLEERLQVLKEEEELRCKSMCH